MTERECRRVLAERSDMLCERCGIGSGLTLHHRRKRSAGGPWTASNCVMLCGHGTAGCHGWVEANPKAAMESGWWVSRYADEKEIPVFMWHGWVYLDDDGGMNDVS